MDRRAWVALLGGLVASALLLLPGLEAPPPFHPLETAPAGSLLDELVAGFGSPRLGHALLGMLAVLVVGLAGSPVAAFALLVSPAFFLSARSSIGGVAAVAPIALAGCGAMSFLESSRTRSGVLALVGGVLAAVAVGAVAGGVLGFAILVAAVSREDRELEPGIARSLDEASRVRPPAIAWTIAIVAGATLGGVAIADALGGRPWPGSLDDARTFDRGIGDVVLGLYPLALALPAGFALRGFTDRASRFWLAYAMGWMAAASLWPDAAPLLLAPAAPLAVVAGSTWRELARSTERAVVVGLATVVVALLVARSFSLDGGQLVGAHAPGGVATDLPLGTAWWLAFSIAGAGFAAAVLLRRGRSLAIALALIACGAIAIDTVHRRWPRAARQSSLVELVELAERAGVTLHVPLGIAEHQLVAPGCQGVIVATTELAVLQRALSGRFFVIGPERVEHVLATSCLPPGLEDVNPLREGFLAALPSPLPGRPIDAEWDGKLRLVAVDAPATIAIDRPIPVVLVFEVLAPLAEGTFATMRLEGCGHVAWGDHRFAAPPHMWRAGNVLIDRQELVIEDPLPGAAPCDYRLFVGLRAGRAAVPATRGGDDGDRVHAATISVAPAAR